MNSQSTEDLRHLLKDGAHNTHIKRLACFYSLSKMLQTEKPLSPIGMIRVGGILEFIHQNSEKGGYSKEELEIIVASIKWARVPATVVDGYRILSSETGHGPSLEQFLSIEDENELNDLIESWKINLRENDTIRKSVSQK